MTQFAFVNSEGEIQYTVSPGGKNMYTHLEVLNGMTAIEITDMEVDDAFFVENYWANGAWVSRGARPGDYYEWKAGAWTLNKPLLISKLKDRRREALRLADWTQLPDVSLTPAEVQEWRTYRQELRNLPTLYPNITHINEVVWPVPPA